MPELAASAGRTAFLFAAAGDPVAAALMSALRAVSIEPASAGLVSRGLAQLCRRPAGAAPPAVVIILGGLSGLGSGAIAKAVRGLPGLAEVPLIVVGEAPPGLARCAAIDTHFDIPAICRLADEDPDTWHASSRPLAAATAKTVLSADAVFDPRHLVSLRSRAPDAVREIIQALQDDVRKALDELPPIVDAGDLSRIAKAAHKLKGSSGSIGANELSQVCAQLEHAAKAGHLANARRAIAAMEPVIHRLIPRLDLLLATDAGTPSTGP